MAFSATAILPSPFKALVSITAHPKLCAQLREVDFVSVFAHDINHIHRDDHRDTQLQQLCGKVKIALHVGAVHNGDDRIRFSFTRNPRATTSSRV